MKHQNQLIIPNQVKKNTKGVFSVLVMAILMLSMSWKANAQITYTFNGSSTEWLNNSNWSPSTAYPGSKTVTNNNDIAYFNTNIATNVGINMTTQAGTHYLGALYFGTSSTSSRAVVNSTGTFGTLYFNGVSLNGVNNTIIWHQSSVNHYFNWGSTPLSLGLNATDHVIQITGSGGLFIASVITGASKNLEKAGTGVLTLERINTYTGNTTISAGTLALSGIGSIATSPNIIIGSSGRFNVSGLNTALTLASTQTLKASATGGNTTGSIILGSSKNLTLSAGGLTFTALASTTIPALTVAGGASSIDLNSSPITVPDNLSVGTYKLIGKSQSASVTGTPGTLSYTGSSNNTLASVALTNGEFVLTVITSSAPTVTNTTPATNIATTSATLAGNVTSIGTASISNNGSVYSLTATNAAPQISGTGVTQLATSSPGAGTGTFSNNVSSTLSVNAQYSYNAYAINSVGTSYGTVSTFYTLANVPSAPTVNNPTTSSLDVTINVNSNPSATEFAIQETGGNYVQANGTLSGSAVWQTAATWGTKTVTGLASSTTYTFQVKARNGANTETTFGTSAGGLVSAIPTNNWTGGTGNWNTGSNWSLSRVPLNTDNITISSGSPVMDIDHTLTTGRTLTISGTGSLTINPTISLTIAGVADFGGKLVTLQSDATGTAAIGTVAGTLNNASNVSVQRFVSGGKRAFRFFSHPFSSPVALSNMMGSTGLIITGSNGASNGFDATLLNNPSAFTFSEAAFNGTNNSGWSAFTNTSNTIAVGAGIRALHRGARTQLPAALASNPPAPQSATISWSGNISAGNKTFNMTKTAGANGGWNLIGNPYPSAVNVGQIESGNRNSIGNFYVWNPSLSTAGGYETKSFGVDYILPSGSAFFINTPSDATFTFTEANKSTSTPAVLHKSNELMQNALELQLRSDSSIHWDNFVLRNRSQLTDAFEYTADGLKMKNSDVNVYSISSDNKNLSIDNRALNESKEVNLAFETSSPYHFTFKVSHIEMADLAVYLEDKFANKVVLLTQNTAYDFVTTADAASHGLARFKLTFKNAPATSLAELNTTKHVFSLYPNPASSTIHLSLANPQGTYTYAIYNQLGLLVQSAELNYDTQRSHAINIESLSNGIYFVKIDGEQVIRFAK